MKKIALIFCLFIFMFSSLYSKNTQQPNVAKQAITTDDYSIAANGDLHIKNGEDTVVLEIDALPDSQIIKDDDERILILSDKSELYQHGILGDNIEATSITIVQVTEKPMIISKFSVPDGWVIESIRPIWSDWDGDGVREIVLTLSNSESGAKLALYDEEGTLLAESLPIGKGFRWRHALDIASFGDRGERLLVDVKTPHIGGIVSYYSWDKENRILKEEVSLTGFSTHDIGSRDMQMYSLMVDESNNQVLLILPDQSKTELVALSLKSREIQEEWRLTLGGKLTSNLELIYENEIHVIRGTIDNDREVSFKIPKIMD